MRNTCIVLLLTLAVLISAWPQKSAQAQATDTKALTDLEEKWVTALAKSDTATLDSVLSDTYVDTDEHGQRSDKQAVLSVLRSGELKIESIKLSDMRVHRYGDAAVVTGSAVQIGNFKGQPLAPKIVFTDTFVKEGGKWRAVASHRSNA